MLPCAALTQPVSIGIAGAVPISAHSQSYGQQCFTSQPALCGPNDLIARPFAAGPLVQARLPWNFSIEAGVLYQRFHRDISLPLTIGRAGYIQYGQRTGVSAGGWLFPLQLRYTFGHRRLRPFVNAGATLRHLGVFEGDGLRLDFGIPANTLQTAHFRIASGRDLDAAVTGGAGVLRRVGRVDLALEVRILHWTSTYYQPAQDQAMLVLSVTFPAQR